MTTADLEHRFADELRRASEHAFLEGVRNGTLPAAAFRTWLAQDYLFVWDLLAFQGRLVGRAPRPAQAVIVGGLVALEAELTWFEQQAAPHNLALDVPRHAVTASYKAFLDTLDDGPYAAAITALWVLERTYLEAWRFAAPGHPDYREFVDHWTAPPFAAYVAGLARAVDAALEDSAAVEAAERALLRTASLEQDFWEMAWAFREQPAEALR